MTVSLQSYTFGSLTTHQTVLAEPYDLQNVPGRYFGVIGETELRDAQKGRFLRLPAIFKGAASKSALEIALNAIEDKANTLHGTLTVDSVTYENTTFLGLERIEGMRYDGSGVNGWFQRGILVFRQLKRNA